MTALRLVTPAFGGPDHTTAHQPSLRMPNRIEAANIRWSALITNLRAAGMSVRGIAHRCGFEPQTLTRMQSEVQSDPRWTQALALLNLHQMVCPEKHKLSELRA